MASPITTPLLGRPAASSDVSSSGFGPRRRSRRIKQQRTNTTTQHVFTRPFPEAVTYDLSVPDQATIRLPRGSTWTSGPHWHDTHTEFLQVLSGRARVMLGIGDIDSGGGDGGGNNRRYGRRGGSRIDDRDGGAEEDEDDDDAVTMMPSVGPADGVIIIPKGTVHEWCRSSRGRNKSNSSTNSTAQGTTHDDDDDDSEEELVVREWTDPKDGQKESFFRQLNGIILDALRAEAEVEAEEAYERDATWTRDAAVVVVHPHGTANSTASAAVAAAAAAAGPTGDRDNDDNRKHPTANTTNTNTTGGNGTAKSWRMRTLDLELNNLFWRRDNYPLVLPAGRGWPGWCHGVATRTVLLGSVVLGEILGIRGFYEDYEVLR